MSNRSVKDLPNIPGNEVDADADKLYLVDSSAAGLSRSRSITPNELVLESTGLSSPTGSSLVGFAQSGSGAIARDVQGRLRDAVHVFDFIPVSEHAAIVAGTSTTDVSVYIQAAIDTTKGVIFQAGTYKANNLTQSTNRQGFFCLNGIAQIVKNANGDLFTASGANTYYKNIDFRGESATPAFTGHNFVGSGFGPVLDTCAAQWAFARAVKITGSHAQILGTCGIYQTTATGATDYDIELGVSGTATLYHQLEGVYTSQTTGGILLTDTGEHTILGGQFGKLTIASGTTPAGSGGGKTIGARILGDVTVDLPNAVFAGNKFGVVAITFTANTSGCHLDLTNDLQSGATVTNNGNQNNLIMKNVSSGSVSRIRFGDDNSFAVLTATHTSPGRFKVTGLEVPNNDGVRFRNAADDGENGRMLFSAAGDFQLFNGGSNRVNSYIVTGTAGARHQFLTNGGNTLVCVMDTGGIRAGDASGPYISPSVGANVGDAAATLTTGTSAMTQRWETELTADRAVTLSTTGAANGSKFRIVRPAVGAFNLNVGTGPLKALAAGEWCDVEYNGSAWMLTAYGSL